MVNPDIGDFNLRYRLGYLLTVSFLSFMTAIVPGTFLWTGNNRICSVMAAILMYVLSITSFYLVQGSDPGYIESEAGPSHDCDEENLEYPHDGAEGDFYGTNPTVTTQIDEGNENEKSISTEPSSILSNESLAASGSNYRPGGPSGLLTASNRRKTAQNDPAKRAKKMSGTGGRGTASAVTLRKGDSNSTISNGTINDVNADCKSYCKYCEMSVPLRSHHCNFCQKCVATFDHHCFVIGTCIGERNHCRFYSCISLNFLGVWCLSIIVDSAFKIVPTKITGNDGSGSISVSSSESDFQTPINLEVAYISSVFLGIIWWYLFLLVSYQTWLVITSSTGYECIKSNNAPTSPNRDDDYETCDSPYGGKNIFENLFSFCCLRDGFISILRNVPWKPMNWKKPAAKPNIEDVSVWHNFCRNKYYSCC